MIPHLLENKAIDALILDRELEKFSSIFQIKTILKINPTIKIIIFPSFSDKIYASHVIKAGFQHAYIKKKN
jgi:DNA-binding NarL/FixJ family response regulator